MQSSLFLVLRRMRAPLLAVTVVWTVSITGLVVIPGEDAAGHPVRMDFLHALYFISYTATTIGFGEIPYSFTPAQRLWVTFCIYLTVVAWSYAFVKLLALFQDRWFLQAIAEQRFKHQVRRLSEPFYLVCGYGESGRLLCRAFDGMGRRFVVLDADEQRLAELEAADYRSDTPALAADARDPETLMLAGVKHRQCAAVLALTGEERANVAVAAAVRLLRPDLTLICRAESPAPASEMRLFGVDRIINPHQQFADYLSVAIQSPGSYQLMAWLTGLPGTTLEPETEPPGGPWLIYGDGYFADQVAAKLYRQGAEVWTLGVSPGSGPPLAVSAERWQAADAAGDIGEALRNAGVER
ncbi:MAG: NAD-binding protein, partial [Methylotetracoccus sp.]|nr:NAD-binding protein [Methylotetracoccus sp.]